ncbi:hypothetical protein HN51_014644 [Arachis hypogaea]
MSEKITRHDKDTRESIGEKYHDTEVNEKVRVVVEHHESEELEAQREPGVKMRYSGNNATGATGDRYDNDRKVIAVEDLDEWHEDFLKMRTHNSLVYPTVMSLLAGCCDGEKRGVIGHGVREGANATVNSAVKADLKAAVKLVASGGGDNVRVLSLMVWRAGTNVKPLMHPTSRIKPGR